MKVLLLASFPDDTTQSKYGGAERVLTNLANWLGKNTNNEIFLVSVEGHGQPYKICDDIIFDSFPLRTDCSKLKIHFQILKNTKLAIRKFKPDIIVCFSIYPMLYAMLQHKLSSKKIKFFFSERNDPRLEYGLLSRIIRWFVLKRADGIVFQTNDAMNYFPDSIKRKSIVIHNPVSVDVSKYPLWDKTDNRIVTVGRLAPQKNQKLLIEAFDKIKDVYPELTLEIYGEGPLRNELQSIINEKSLNNRVFLKGARSDILDCIYGARLFVLPSLYEGMPNALMEAMALGIPVISSDCPCGGPRELIDNGKNGILFINNNINDLIMKIKSLLNNKNIIDITSNEIKIRQNHSIEKIFNKWRLMISNNYG